MIELSALWLPILLSAVFVFIVSSVIHMATPMHKKDMCGMPNEEDVGAAMRKAGLKPGDYMMPWAPDMKACSSPEFVEKFKRGPVAMITVLPNGSMNIGKSLMQWFVWCLFVGVYVAYVSGLALAPGAEYMAVFRMAGAVAVLAYAFTNICNSIWKGTSWGTTSRFVVDGVLYGLTTAGTFAWLWPDAAAAAGG